MYIRVSSVCSETPPHTRSRSSHCAGNPSQLLLRVSSECALALNISGQRSLNHQLFGLSFSASSSSRRKKKSAATVPTQTQPVCCHPCAVWLRTSRVPICCIFAVSWVAPFLLFLNLVTCSCHKYECPWPRRPTAMLVQCRVIHRLMSLNVWCCMWSGQEMNTG